MEPNSIQHEMLSPNWENDNETTIPGDMQITHHIAPLGLLIFKGVCMTVITLTNIFANIMCLTVLRRVRELNPVTKAFMFNFTASDLATGIFICIPIIGSIIVDSWPYGQFLCSTLGIFNIVFTFTSFMSLLNVNLERFLAVTRPFEYPHLVTVGRAYASIVMLWILSISMGTLNAILPGRFADYSAGLHTCTVGPEDNDKIDIIGSVLICLFVIVPFSVTLFLFLRLFLLARFHAKQIAAVARTTTGTDSKIQRKSFITFFIMTMCLTVCYIPLVVTFSYENLTRKELPITFVYIAELLTFSNSVSNVLIYYARSANFRNTAKHVLQGVCPMIKVAHEDEGNSVTHTVRSCVNEMTVSGVENPNP